MNERIFQLGVQAKREFEEHVAECESLGKPIEWIAEERLVELVVKECMKVISEKVSMKFKNGGETEDFMGGHFAAAVLAKVEIAQHFGVKLADHRLLQKEQL